MWAAIIPVIGLLLQIILSIITHGFASGDKKVTKKDTALDNMAAAAKKGDFDAFFDALADFHSVV